MILDGTPDPVDGLTRMQRAVLRYLHRHPKWIRCSKLAAILLADPRVPGEVSEPLLDATLLTMAHPSICSKPALEYGGGPQHADGFIPGAPYRMVAASDSIHWMMRGLGPSDDWWSPEPVKLSVPFAMTYGSASWNVEPDPADPSNQAMRRITCAAVHVLAAEERLLASAASPHRREDWIVADLARWDSSGKLPHGIAWGAREREVDGRRERYLLSGPRMVLLGSDPEIGGQWVGVEQPACGRHWGQELELLGATDTGRLAPEDQPKNSPTVVPDVRPVSDLAAHDLLSAQIPHGPAGTPCASQVLYLPVPEDVRENWLTRALSDDSSWGYRP